MRLAANLKSNREPSPARKQATSSASETLSPSELQSLKQGAKDADDWLREDLRRNPIRI